MKIFTKIAALLYVDFILIRKLGWKLVETIYLPLTSVLIWGFFAAQSKDSSFEAGLLVLLVNIFWSFMYLVQSTANMQMMDDVWSGSIKQMFLAGIQENAYMAARLIFAVIIATIVLVCMFGVGSFFGATSIPLGFALLVYVTSLLGALGLAVLLGGLIILLGKNYGFLAWTALQLFIVFSFPFYPLEKLPVVVQWFASMMPFTFVFEIIKQQMSFGTYSVNLMIAAVFVSVLYLVLSWPIYLFCFRRAQKKGNLAKL